MNKFSESIMLRYPDLHPLLLHRILEKCSTEVEAFDMIEDMPKDYPIIWDDDQEKWKHVQLVFTDELKEK